VHIKNPRITRADCTFQIVLTMKIRLGVELLAFEQKKCEKLCNVWQSMRVWDQ